MVPVGSHESTLAPVDGVTPLDPGEPTTVGGYELIGRLGKGGMGTVYLARAATGRRVAIKLIRPELAVARQFRARFGREADNARRVARFCTAEVIEADPFAERPYLVTEFVEGPTLARAVAASGPLAAADLERLAVGVAAALTAIHSAGVIHRDLKPSNVVLSPLGPRVIDFGVARASDTTVGLTGELGMIGTPAFMSPEQVRGEPVSPAADTFAWGGVVAFAATGRAPFGAGSPAAMLYRTVHEPPDLQGLDGGLRSIVASAMDKDPARRPSAQTLMLQLVADPKTVLGFVPPPLAEVPRVPAEPQPRRMATEWDEPTTEAGPAAAAAGEPRPRSRSLAPAPAPRRRTALLAAGLLVVAAGTAGFLVASAADPGQPRRAGDTRTAVRPLPRSAAPLAADALVYQSTRGDTSSIVSIRADGTGRRQLTDGRELGELPVLTPDRRTMIYYEGRSRTLRVAAADGSASRALFSGGPAAAVRVARLTSPSLSPDGRSLVVRADGGPAGAGLYVLRVDGSAARPLGSGPDATDPAWSPDGSGIVYSSGAGPAGGAIFSIRADGSGPPRQLTAGGAAGTDSQPTFSPSLDCIAFTRGTGGPGNAEVFLMKPDGSSQRAITTVPGADTDPSWSPDGKKIAFASGRDGNREIYVMNWRGTNQTRLTRDPAADASPVWGAG